jgi:uncharacterized protein (DUF1810 family)
MWYVFPQVAGLGSSSMAQRYAIRSEAEAIAYLNHEILGTRLRECVQALLALETNNPDEVMGFPDNMKLKSSLTLFAAISPSNSLFHAALKKYFGGEVDEMTVAFINRNK